MNKEIDESIDVAPDVVAAAAAAALGRAVNLNSLSQLKKIIYEERGHADESGQRLVSSAALQMLAEASGDEFVSLVVKYREAKRIERKNRLQLEAREHRDLWNYQDIADELKVEVTSIYQYVLVDVAFPKPSVPGRSPLFKKKDVMRYKKFREAKNLGYKGRPPRSLNYE